MQHAERGGTMSSEIKWPKGSYMATLRKQVREHNDLILNGSMIAIDPASVRSGYAVTEAGKIIEQGVITVPATLDVGKRLQYIVNTLQEDREYDVLAIELIRGKMAHAFLKFAVGAIMGGVKVQHHIEVPIIAWKAVAGKGYVKEDSEDAAMIARTVVLLAKEESEKLTKK